MKLAAGFEHRSVAKHLTVIAGLLLICGTASAYDATPSRDVDLSGHWKIDAAASDDAEALLQERLEKERRRWARAAPETDELGLPPVGGTDAQRHAPATGQPPSGGGNRRGGSLLRLLGQTKRLEITQSGSKVQIVSDAQSRRFDAGTRSQVSMPEGELADSKVGWDGEWFVVDRRVRRGPRVTEKYRLVKNTGQLEYVIAWRGDHLLSGITVRRVFDRAAKDATAANPEMGPVR